MDWIVKSTSIQEIQDADTFTDGFSIDPVVIQATYSKIQYTAVYTHNTTFDKVIDGALNTIITLIPADLKQLNATVVHPQDTESASSFTSLPIPTGTVFEHAGSWKPSSAVITFNDDGIAEVTLNASAFDKEWQLDNVDAHAKYFEPNPHNVRLLMQDKKNGQI